MIFDRVQETTTTTGTGTVNLAGAVTGYEGFVAAVGTGNTCYYCIFDSVSGDWEVGSGTVTDASPDTLSRATVLQSSNSDALVNFSAGTKRVFVTLPANRAIYEDSASIAEITNLVLTPSSITNITAGGGITVTNGQMRVQGSGGAVTITANPQIAAGVDGQIVVVQGQSNTNTITISTGTGLHLHSGSTITLRDHDYLTLVYDSGTSEWEEIASNFPVSDKVWSFGSPSGSSGTFYVGGFYEFGTTNFTPAAGTTLGSANNAYGAYAFLVLGASSTDMYVTISGTSMTDEGVRVSDDTEELATGGGSTNDYFETSKKWIGTVNYFLASGTGVTINNGLVKYWDNRNSDFRIVGVEVVGLAGANDSGNDILVRHHKATGWTYNVGAAPTPPTELASMNTDYSTEGNYVNNEQFAWKRVDLNVAIGGNNGEGFIGEIVTGANNAVQHLDFMLSIRAD